jgi:hypothetical protein
MTYTCEVCGKSETLSQDEAFSAGWDYPPFIGAWGVISPRTCPECPMTSTVWWALQMGAGADSLTDHQLDVVARIQAETLDTELININT